MASRSSSDVTFDNVTVLVPREGKIMISSGVLNGHALEIFNGGMWYDTRRDNLSPSNPSNRCEY
jgi:hypothetical protein